MCRTRNSTHIDIERVPFTRVITFDLKGKNCLNQLIKLIYLLVFALISLIGCLLLDVCVRLYLINCFVFFLIILKIFNIWNEFFFTFPIHIVQTIFCTHTYLLCEKCCIYNWLQYDNVLLYLIIMLCLQVFLVLKYVGVIF